MKKLSTIICLIAVLSLAGCAGRSERSGDSSQAEAPEPESTGSSASAQTLEEADINLLQYQALRTGEDIAIIKTSMGEIRIRFFPKQAPKAVANFIGLAGEGYFDGKLFHRVIQDFMIQSGAMSEDGVGGKSIYTDDKGETIPFAAEYSTDLWHFRGAVSMAHPPDQPDNNLSQFFIVQNSGLSDKTLEALKTAHFPVKVIDRYRENGGAPHLDWEHSVFGHVYAGMQVVDAIAAVETENERPVEAVFIESVTIEAYK